MDRHQMKDTSKHSENRKMTAHKEDAILSLYAWLDKIASDDLSDKDLNKAQNKFERFFANKGVSKRLKHFQPMFKQDFLQGSFTNEHASKPLLDETKNKLINGDTLLLRAMSIHVEKDSKQDKILNNIIEDVLVSQCPELIFHPKQSDDYHGFTPLHLAILNGNEVLLKKMADASESRTISDVKHQVCAKGPVFRETVMMAGTPLGVAALKFNKRIFNFVLEHFAPNLCVTNDNNDNIIHSLIKFSHLQPDKLEQVLEMISYVIDYKYPRDGTFFDSHKIRKLRENSRELLMMKNKDGMNPLQLAAKRQQFQIFELIMQNEVYHSTESGDGFFNEEVYDISEIETVQLKEYRDRGRKDENHHESVLEYLVHQETRNAFPFVDFRPVKEVIREKWKSYRWFFMSWFAVHFVFMINISVAAVYRSKLEANVRKNETADFSHVVTHNAFVTTESVIGLVFGLIYLSIEISTRIISRYLYRTSSNIFKRSLRNFSSPYSNQIFRIYFVLFSLFLILDFAFAASGYFSGYENYCLIFAVIIGWYLMMFFLKTFKAFSIFTVLIQKAITDMMKFSLVMTFFLVAFSVAMYMIMQGAETKKDEDDFKKFEKTMFKMLNIMLGNGELDILFQARHPYLAVFVFVLFVLLTTILLLNALIAMMSNTCTDLMSNYGGAIAAKLHCRLQKLSVILFLEGWFPLYLCKEVGTKTSKRWYHNNKWVRGHVRRIWIRNSLHDRHTGNEVDKATHSLKNDGIVSKLMRSIASMKMANIAVDPETNTYSSLNKTNENLARSSTLDIANFGTVTMRDKEINFPETI